MHRCNGEEKTAAAKYDHYPDEIAERHKPSIDRFDMNMHDEFMRRGRQRPRSARPDAAGCRCWPSARFCARAGTQAARESA